MDRICLADRETIARQIGRSPRGEITIARRCVYGHPQVLQVHPIVDGKPFPTLYWLSCPFLRRAIGDLEGQGWVGRLERRLAVEEELRDALDRAHAEYIAARRRLLSADAGRELGQRGIGGIADRRRLKCLHLHVAHALVGGNPIGDAVLGMLERRACEAEKTICSSLARGRSRSEINR